MSLDENSVDESVSEKLAISPPKSTSGSVDDEVEVSATTARFSLADDALRLLKIAAIVAYAVSGISLLLAWFSFVSLWRQITSSADASQPIWTSLLEHLDALLLAVFIAPHVLFVVVVYSFARAFGRALSSSEDEAIPTPVSLLARQLRKNG